MSRCSFGQIMMAVLLTTVVNAPAHTQIYDKWKGKNIEKLYNQTTHIILEREGNFYERLKKAFEEYWKITPYELHNKSKGLPRLEPSSSVFAPGFVTLTKKRTVPGLGTSSTTIFGYPFFVFGEANQSGTISGEGIVAAFPINAFHYEFDVRSDSMFSGSLLRIPYVIRTLHDMLANLKENKSDKDYFKTVGARSSSIGKKTLIIPADLVKKWDVNPNTTAFMNADLDAGKKKMKAINHAMLEENGIGYRGQYKIMSTEEILKLEQSEDAGNYTLFLPAISDHQYVMVFDLKTKELLYFEMDKMGMRIQSKDFDKLNAAAGL